VIARTEGVVIYNSNISPFRLPIPSSHFWRHYFSDDRTNHGFDDQNLLILPFPQITTRRHTGTSCASLTSPGDLMCSSSSRIDPTPHFQHHDLGQSNESNQIKIHSMEQVPSSRVSLPSRYQPNDRCFVIYSLVIQTNTAWVSPSIPQAIECHWRNDLSSRIPRIQDSVHIHFDSQ
jgi:hypothetical protein